MSKIEGLIAATYTPFDAEGNLNIERVPDYAHYLKKSGVRGVFVNGTTGEGVSLSLDERKRMAEVWVAQKGSNFMVLIHVGHNSLPVAQELARHAEQIHADGIGAMGPTFFKPSNSNDLAAYNAQIAQTAKSLPFYYYHIPSMTGIHIPMIQFLKEATLKIPNLAGIKFTHEDLMDMKQCLEYKNGRYDVLHGRDEILSSGLILGVKGAIGSTYNYMAPLYLKLMEAFYAKDFAKADELQFRAIRIVEILLQFGGSTKAGKSFMRIAGLDLGSPRLPNIGLSDLEEEALSKKLNALNFLDDCYSG